MILAWTSAMVICSMAMVQNDQHALFHGYAKQFPSGGWSNQAPSADPIFTEFINFQVVLTWNMSTVLKMLMLDPFYLALGMN